MNGDAEQDNDISLAVLRILRRHLFDLYRVRKEAADSICS